MRDHTLFQFYPKSTGDAALDRNARTLQHACLIGILALAITTLLGRVDMRPGVPLGLVVSILSLLLAAWLNRLGKWEWGARTAIAAMLTTAVLMVVEARDGFRSHAMLLFPGTLLLAVMLLDRISYTVASIAAGLAVTGLGIAEIFGYLQTERTPANFSAVVSVDLELFAMAFIGSLIVRDTQRNIQDVDGTIRRMGLLNQELRRSSEKYAALIENAVDAIFITCRDGVILEVNRQACRLTGVSKEALVGAPIDQFLQAREPDAIQVAGEGTGQGRVVECAVIHSDGSEALVEAKSSLTPGGQIQYFCRETVERKRAERALRDSEERYRRIVETASEGIWVHDAAGVTTYVNQCIAQMLGYATAEMVGKSLFEFIDDEMKREAERLFARRKTGVSERHDFRFKHKDGSDVYTLISTTAIVGDDGTFFGALGMITDISARKRADDAARRSGRQFAAIFEHAADVLFEVAVEVDGFRFVSANPAFSAVTGLKRSQVIGRRIEEVIPQDSCEVVLSRYQEAVTSGMVVRWEETTEYPAGRKHAAVSVAPVFDENGKCSRLIGAVHDLTELKRSQDERRAAEEALLAKTRALEEANRRTEAALAARTDFLTSVSHEIRTPMNGVTGMAGLLMNTELNAEQRELVQVIDSSSRALLTIINDILDLSKIESGKLHLEETVFDLWRVAADAVELMAPAAAQKGLDLALTHSYALPRRVTGDSGRIRQILLNLLGNALKFTEAGYVKMAIAARDGRIEFTVEDSGPGIAAEEIPGLFEKFRQGTVRIRRGVGGLGLGLAICKELVTLMSGAIRMESRVGAGTRVVVSLPLGLANAEQARQPASAALAVAGRMLLVTGLGGSRGVLAGAFRELGLEVVEASTPEEALAGIERGGAGELLAVDTALCNKLPELIAWVGGDERRVVYLETERLAGILRNDRAGSGRIVQWPFSPGRILQAIETHPAVEAKAKEQVLAREGVPRAVAARAGAATGAGAESGAFATAKVGPRARILVAEDNEVNRKVAQRILERMGCVVELAHNGRDAVRLLEANVYDAVLMDVHMPVLDGYAATAAIRALESERRHVPIIAMTAGAFAGDREACLAAGMNDYVSKPVDKGILEAVLSKWLSGGRELMLKSRMSE